MALADLRLAVMTFPQRWDGPTLSFNVLAVPSVDPLADPVAGAAPAFADHLPTWRAVVIPSLDTVPSTGDPTARRVAPTIVAPSPAPAAPPRPVFQQLAAHAIAQGATIAPAGPLKPPSVGQIRKALPASYLAITGTRPNGSTTTTTGDFSCALKSQPPGAIAGPPPATTTWGQLLSYALRQPTLAVALGLRYQMTVPIEPAELAAGGWIYVELDPGDPWAAAASAGNIRLYAGRLPALDDSAHRSLFGAVLFPVADAPGPSVDPEASGEAERYDAGFARIVHAHQPTANDAVTGDTSSLPAGTDPGIQIGWDDEQVVAWTNRQLGLMAARAAGTLEAETPLGVLGYRVDVADITGRSPTDTSRLPWESLMQVSTALPLGLGNEDRELLVEPAPIRMNDATTDAWLPHYFAGWRGGCLPVADQVPNQMLKKPPRSGANTAQPVATLLSYGHDYALRVRLGDLSSGGPATGDDPVAPGPDEVATVAFQRMTPPKSPLVTVGADQVTFGRPAIGYPEVLYTHLGDGAADRTAIVSHYVTTATTMGLGKGAVAGLPDPDVSGVRITVEVAAPAHDDPGPAGLLDGTFRVLYTTTRDLPDLPSGPTPADAGLTVDLAFVDAASITDWAPDGWPTSGPLVIPRARRVHLRVEPILRHEPGYYGDAASAVLTTTVELRAEARREPSLLIADDSGDPVVRGLLFRRPAGVSAPNVSAQLAQILRVIDNGLTFTGRPGQRVVFGASKAIRHDISADGGSITIASQSELLRNWIVALDVELDRDWTWDGLAGPISVTRNGEVVGSITVPAVASPAAVADPARWQRNRTRLVFLDAVDPHEATASGFPEALAHEWTLAGEVVTETGPVHGVAGSPTFVPTHIPEPPQAELNGAPQGLTLPIAIPPKQMPKLASVGMALSPYTIGEGYATTGSRQRALWLELAEPIANPAGDDLFARLVGHGADPLLYNAEPSLDTPDEPPLTLDPELVRIIVPHDSDDRAGIDAMIRLEKATDSDLHYLLPLPPGITADSPELFGFWTWELRVGHAGDPHAPGQEWWSTAQGRFGRALRVNGVQHPAPELACRAARAAIPSTNHVPPCSGTPSAVIDALGALSTPRRALRRGPKAGGVIDVFPDQAFIELIEATAPYATPTLNGQPLVTPIDRPATTMCFLLYAQVVQADGSSNRNVLLQWRYGVFIPPPRKDDRFLPDTQRDRISRTVFCVSDIEEQLRLLGLPTDSALSVLAVELLPGGTGNKVAKPPPLDAAAAAELPDPLGAELGPGGRPQRILRVSPLVAVAPSC